MICAWCKLVDELDVEAVCVLSGRSLCERHRKEKEKVNMIAFVLGLVSIVLVWILLAIIL